MTCPRETVMQALATVLTSALVAQYGAGRVCSRDLGFDPQGIMPEQSPRLTLWESQANPIEDDMAQEFERVSVRIIGNVKKRAGSTEQIQTQLNELRYLIKQTLRTSANSLGGISVSVTRGIDTTSAGEQEGVLDFPITIYLAE